MSRIRSFAATLLALVPLALGLAPNVARAETRIGLVIGNSEYQAGALATAANDAGLIAQTLQAAGFDVVGARDLDQDALRRAFRDFVEKATSAGPDTVAFIYVAGYGLQLEGENYVVPVDGKIARDTDVAAQAVRMSDYIRPLAALRLKATVVVLDAARANSFVQSGPALAGGLALAEPEPGMLIAFNATPGTVGPQQQGSYGAYAQALAEMLREGGLPLADVFDRVRLRVNDISKGAEVPWHASKVESKLVFFERAPDAPPLAVTSEQTAAIQARPIREFSAQDAYAAALQRDTLDGYQDFLAAYPDDAMAKRVRALVATRREAITWRRTCADNTTAAYWSYLRRYPQGPHAMDARRRLTVLSAALEPPPSFAAIDYGLPPPPPEEIVYVRRPVLAFDDPEYAFAPPPPAPVVFLAPRPREYIVLEPPPPPIGIYVLPMPIYRPVPVWVRPPVYVAAPPANNIIYANVHNTVVINNVTNTAVITNRSGQTTTVGPQAPAAQPVAPARRGAAPTPAPAPAAVAAIGPALPPSVAQKAATQQALRPPGGAAQPAAQPGAPPAPGGQAVAPSPAQPGRPLPGMQGQPLPAKPPLPAAATTPTAPGAAKPGTAALPSPATASKPGTPAPAPGATRNAKPGAPSQPPAVRLAPSPSQPGTSPAATPPAGNAKPGTPPPAARLAPPQSGSAKPIAPSPPVPPSGNARPATPPNPAAATPPAAKPTPPPVAARPTPPAHPPAARLAPPPAAAPKPVAPQPPSAARVAPPPPSAARVAPPPAPPVARPTPPQVPPVARPAAPPPALAGARPAVPAPPPAARPAAPQPRGCPPGKTMAVVNGQPTCR